MTRGEALTPWQYKTAQFFKASMQLYVYGRRRDDQPKAEDQAEIDAAVPACGAYVNLSFIFSA